jgi:nucleoside-diphosphate-sugar epimerase
MKSVQELERKLSEPSVKLTETLAKLDGDLLILGAGGKMGPSLARLAKNAIDEAGAKKKVFAVSRFSSGNLREELEASGIETIAADLLNEEQLQSLPDVKNVIFMAGNKFGTTGREYYSWAMNAYLPGRVAEKYRHSRIVSFSTGNVYPLTPVSMQGVTEDHPTAPVGEYAQSCLGRERVFEYFSRLHKIPMVHFRLNYANDLRYGVLLEIARSVYERKPIDLRMGHVNVIWQGDANEFALRSLAICECPPRILNVTGPETVSIRWLAKEFAKRFNVEPEFHHDEENTALLSNASESHKLFGYPRVTLKQMIDWTADWVASGGETLDKPTHFQERKGAF